MPSPRRLTWLLALSVSSLALGGPPDKERSARDLAAADAAKAIGPSLPPNAPQPPAESIKKTQPGELKKLPGKKAIKSFEDDVYQLQKPEALVWGYATAAAIHRKNVDRALEELRAGLEEVKATQPDWPRIPEYEQHVAFFEGVVKTHRDHLAGVASAKYEAASAASAAVDAAWKAKRATDDGPHAQHAGAVVFGSKAVTGDEAAMTSTTVDAPLFARAFFKESGWNALHTAGIDCGAESSPAFRYYVLARPAAERDFTEVEVITPDQATFQKATSLELSRKGSLTAGGAYTKDDEQTASFRWLTAIASRLQPGDQAVEVEVRAWCKGSRELTGLTVAKATLTVKTTAAARDALAKKGRMKLPASVHPASALAEKRTLVTRHFEGKGFTLVDFRTVSEWETVKHPATGAILHRAANAFALVKDKNSAGCELYSLVLQEPWNGSGYGPTLNFGQALSRRFVCNVD